MLQRCGHSTRGAKRNGQGDADRNACVAAHTNTRAHMRTAKRTANHDEALPCNYPFPWPPCALVPTCTLLSETKHCGAMSCLAHSELEHTNTPARMRAARIMHQFCPMPPCAPKHVRLHAYCQAEHTIVMPLCACPTCKCWRPESFAKSYWQPSTHAKHPGPCATDA